MIKVTAYTEYVENALNSLREPDADYEFKIYPNEGEFYAAVQTEQLELPKTTVFGVARFISTDTIPLKDLGIYHVAAGITVLAIVPRGADSNFDEEGHINTVADVLQRFYATKTGDTGTFTDEDDGTVYAFIFAAETPATGGEMAGTYGRGVPLSLTVSWSLIKDGVLFNNVNITVDGVPVMCTDFSFENNLTPQTDNINNENYLRSYARSQALLVSVILPYRNNDLCRKLIGNIWDNDLTTTYSVHYTDAVIPEKTKTMLATQIVMTGQVGTNCTIRATFVLSR